MNECLINNGNCSQICHETYDSFFCRCQPGYQVNTDVRYPCNKAGEVSYCISYYGIGRMCFCSTPINCTIPMNSTTCSNVNECLVNNGGCSQTCTDTVGSYLCSCNRGFMLSNDMRNCMDVNECVEFSNACPTGTCVNNPGGYTCVQNGNNPAGVGSQVSDSDAPSSQPVQTSSPLLTSLFAIGAVVTAAVNFLLLMGCVAYRARVARRQRLQKNIDS